MGRSQVDFSFLVSFEGVSGTVYVRRVRAFVHPAYAKTGAGVVRMSGKPFPKIIIKIRS